jgi:transposase-like protein
MIGLCAMQGKLNSMIFPISELLSHEQSVAWIEQHFHPNGLCCPSCGAPRAQARPFRTTQRGVLTYRCNRCQSAYNLYSQTLFANSLLPPATVVLLLRGVCKGESTAALAQELKLSRSSVHEWRHKLQQNGYAARAQDALPDTHCETDEMFHNAGEKR